MGFRKSSKIKDDFFNKFSSQEINWESFDSLKEACSNKDIVIHTAGINSKECSRDPINSYKFNSLISGKLGLACHQEKVKVFLYLSTIHVYSNNLVGTINENSKTQKKDFYTKSKILAENIFHDLSDLDNTKFIILRISNVFGNPLLKNCSCWKLFLNNICKEAITNQTITINSNPLIIRNFISLEFFINKIEHIINDSYNLNYYEIFNITSEKMYTLQEIANLVKKKIKNLLDLEIVIKYKTKESEMIRNSYTSKINIDNKGDLFFEKEIENLILYCRNKFGK
tara:strand:+ start:6372 stop:7223 length:852 start_codon:yes stop_codon:yes gene_type:complete